VTDAPDAVIALAVRRAEARAARDYATADALRAEIADAGWDVVDVGGEFELHERPAYDVLRDIAAVEALPSGLDPARRATVALVVDGWPEDASRCLEALVAFAPTDVGVVALVVGDAHGAGTVVHDIASRHRGRVDGVHVEGPVHFGPARCALLRRDTAEVHIWMETSTVLTGDALTPLIDAALAPGVVGSGWRGVTVDDDWRGFHDAGPGDVEALLGYLFAMRRATAVQVADDPASPFATARFYRNADLALSFWLRESGGRLVVPAADLPVEQTRHRGYHDTDPAIRDRESKRNYDAFLSRFRGREDMRLSRPEED